MSIRNKINDFINDLHVSYNVLDPIPSITLDSILFNKLVMECRCEGLCSNNLPNSLYTVQLFMDSGYMEVKKDVSKEIAKLEEQKSKLDTRINTLKGIK